MSAFSLISLLLNPRRGALLISAIAVITFLTAGTPAVAQTSAPKSAQDPPPPPSPGDNIRYGYAVHQSIDLGGHIANYSGNDAMYDTLVNFQSGPRILDQSLEMIAVRSGAKRSYSITFRRPASVTVEILTTSRF